MPQNSAIMTLGRLTLGTIPRVAAPFTDAISPATVSEAARLGLDIAELRVDQFTEPTPECIVECAQHARPMAVLLTIRSSTEGGAWTDSAARLPLLREVVHAVDAIDIELSSADILDGVVQLARDAKKTAIISWHDFETTPPLDRLHAIAQTARSHGADIVKCVAMPQSPTELKTLAQFTIEASDDPLVVIAMGELGTLSRVAFPAIGSLFTFAQFGHESAPGQLDYIETAKHLARFYPAYRDVKCDALKNIEDQP